MKGGEKKGPRARGGAIGCAVLTAAMALAFAAAPAGAQVELPTQTPDHFLVAMLPAAVAGQPAPITSSPALYCPSVPVSREQMSVFITLTFGLTLYGP